VKYIVYGINVDFEFHNDIVEDSTKIKDLLKLVTQKCKRSFGTDRVLCTHETTADLEDTIENWKRETGGEQELQFRCRLDFESIM
jgi:hypothetical protein